MTFATSIVLSSFLAAADSSAASMGLRDAVQYALEHSPTLKSSEAEISRRQGMVSTARSFLMPQVDLSADAARTHFDRGYPPMADPKDLRFDDSLYYVGAELKLLVWDFRKTNLELSAVKERVETARADVDRRRQELIFDTARLYLQTLTYSDLIGAAQARTRSLRAFLERTNQLVQAGRSVPVDAMKVQTRLAQVESDLATLQSARTSTWSALAAIMGYEGDLPQLSPSPSHTELPVLTPDEKEILQQAEAERADVFSLDHEVRAAELAEKAVRRSAWPRIDFRANVVQYFSDTPVSSAHYASPQAPTPENGVTDWMVGVHLSFNLFDGGRYRGQVRTAQAQAEEVRQARQQLRLRISREVRTALADLAGAVSRVKSLRDSVAESERVLQNERLKFESGRSVIEFVLDAESALLTNQSLLYQAERSVSIATLALDFSAGRIDANKLQP